MTDTPNLKILESIPYLSTLEKLLQQDNAQDVAQLLIDKHKLPYILVPRKDNPSKFEVKPDLTTGEKYLEQFITVDPETIDMKKDAVKMSKSPYEVLIVGDTGTGKEKIARSQIYDRTGSIRIANCAGFPRDLIESELFGYTEGSFTGGRKGGADGLMTSASGGLMFMDEIGELPMDVQAKILRAIQERVVRKIGAKVEEQIDCKFVFATNRNLKKMVEAGQFRKDLYARISTLEIDIKPLSARMCDVVPIAESIVGGKEFLEKYKDDLLSGKLDLSLNVRSIQQHIIRYNVLGK